MSHPFPPAAGHGAQGEPATGVLGFSCPHETPAPVEASREEIAAAVRELLALPQVECPLTHLFAPGVYWREILMPAGSIVIGAEHKTEHFNVVLAGELRLLVAGRWERIVAPAVFVSKPGVQKTLHMLTDVRWATIHPTTETRLDKLEEELIVVTAEYRERQRRMDPALNRQPTINLNAQSPCHSPSSELPQ